MVKADLDQILWKDPWNFEISDLEEELAREVSSQHPLAGAEAIAVARRCDNDDVLFFLPNHDPPLAVVHLTWHRESGPAWPFTVFCYSVEDFITKHIEQDHKKHLGVL